MNNEKKPPVRQIKFRGLRVDGKGWVYGSLVQPNHKNDKCYIIGWNGAKFNVIPETVGQFTGLLDKNGREVYEGDIFTADQYPFIDNDQPNYNGVVYWAFAGFQYYLTLVNKEKRGISEGVNEPLEDGYWIEVISNIHEESDINSIEGKETDS